MEYIAIVCIATVSAVYTVYTSARADIVMFELQRLFVHDFKFNQVNMSVTSLAASHCSVSTSRGVLPHTHAT
jgi:hypothetical protein